jgi:transposase
MRYFVGVDWASLAHAVCVIDEGGQIVMRVAVDHTSEGLNKLVEALRRFGDPAELGIAIERPSGLLVDSLVESGFAIYPIHPNVVKASRPRYSAALGKTDPGDAYLLADLLRTDGHRFRALCPLSDETRALRALVRARSDLVGARVGLANQLRALLESFWAGAVAIFGEIDSPIALAFLLEYPTPASAARLAQKQLAAFLSAQSYSGRRSPDELLQRLRSAPAIQLGPAEMAAKGTLVCTYATLLDTTVRQIRELTSAIERAVMAHSDATVFTSFPRIGKVNAAQILAELGVRDRFLTEEQLAGEAGVAPVTRMSGKHRAVVFRWACNHRLRTALTWWADNSRRASPWAHTVYLSARQRGCDHPHAIRILTRAWLRVLWRCWNDAKPYDVTQHHAAVALKQPA